MDCKYKYKKWPSKKVKQLFTIFPFYDHESLIKITGCTKNELLNFEKKFKKEIKWLR